MRTSTSSGLVGGALARVAQTPARAVLMQISYGRPAQPYQVELLRAATTPQELARKRSARTCAVVRYIALKRVQYVWSDQVEWPTRIGRELDLRGVCVRGEPTREVPTRPMICRMATLAGGSSSISERSRQHLERGYLFQQKFWTSCQVA